MPFTPARQRRVQRGAVQVQALTLNDVAALSDAAIRLA
jgi:hypothetical protein